MVRAVSDSCREVLAGGSFLRHFVADLYFGLERRKQMVPITDPRFSWSDGKVQSSGSCTVVWTDEFAESVSPRAIGDAFAPFGAELVVSEMITAGPFIEMVPVGRFRITDVPDARDEYGVFMGRSIVVGSTVELTLQDEFARIDEDLFDVPTAPTTAQLASVWDEAARLTGMQITESVLDAPIPRSVLYEENRLDAVYELFKVLDAVPFVTVDGTLSARPNAWPAPVDTVRRGPEGTLIDVGYALSPEGVSNRVVVRSESSDNAPILAVAEVTEGPLRVINADGTRSPFGRRTKTITPQLVDSGLSAQQWADRELATSARIGVREIPVKVMHTPLYERGDVLWIEETPGVLVLGRVSGVELDDGDETTLKVEVAA